MIATQEVVADEDLPYVHGARPKKWARGARLETLDDVVRVMNSRGSFFFNHKWYHRAFVGNWGLWTIQNALRRGLFSATVTPEYRLWLRAEVSRVGT